MELDMETTTSQYKEIETGEFNCEFPHCEFLAVDEFTAFPGAKSAKVCEGHDEGELTAEFGA